MFIEEDGLEGLPILDVSAVEMVVLGFVFGDEGCDQPRNLRIVRLCDHLQLSNYYQSRLAYCDENKRGVIHGAKDERISILH
jgi:hypothetical protein